MYNSPLSRKGGGSPSSDMSSQVLYPCYLHFNPHLLFTFLHLTFHICVSDSLKMLCLTLSTIHLTPATKIIGHFLIFRQQLKRIDIEKWSTSFWRYLIALSLVELLPDTSSLMHFLCFAHCLIIGYCFLSSFLSLLVLSLSPSLVYLS